MTAAPAPLPQRWWRYVRKGRFFCPLNHHIPKTAEIPEHGFIRCPRHLDRQGTECGRWIFVYAIRGGGCIIAEVQLSEMRDMEELATPAAIFEYLGIFTAGAGP